MISNSIREEFRDRVRDCIDEMCHTYATEGEMDDLMEALVDELGRGFDIIPEADDQREFEDPFEGVWEDTRYDEVDA